MVTTTTRNWRWKELEKDSVELSVLARDFLYVLWPQRYYFRPLGLSDKHSYAQLSRFTTNEVLDTMAEVALGRKVDRTDVPVEIKSK